MGKKGKFYQKCIFTRILLPDQLYHDITALLVAESVELRVHFVVITLNSNNNGQVLIIPQTQLSVLRTLRIIFMVISTISHPNTTVFITIRKIALIVMEIFPCYHLTGSFRRAYHLLSQLR